MINGRPALVTVFLRKGESHQSLLRRFLKICKKENILEEIFNNGNTRRYNKKSVKEKMKRKEAERRRRAEEIKSQKRNNRKSKYAKH